MYTVADVARIIGVTRQAVYRKMDKEELHPYLKDSAKGKMVTEKGFTILKGMFSDYLESKQAPDTEQQKNSNRTDNLQSDYIASLKAEIENLKQINAVQAEHLKQITIDNSQQMNSLTQLLQNSQVLLKQQQDKIFLLENPGDKEKFSLWNIFKRN